jgi:choline kinase
MTKAIILSAGQGRRLLPLTADRPKCLLDLAGRTLLEWQLDALLSAGVGQVSVVVGFHGEAVESLIARRYAGRGVRAIFNPFYEVADNLASCWMARGAMDSDFVLVNGDTVFEPAVLHRVLESPEVPITLTVDHKSAYDDDDMKVELDGTRVVHVSKTLAHDQVHAESIGLLCFRGTGPALFRDAIDRALRHPTSLRLWYLSVVDALAGEGVVHACSIKGLRWGEIDFPPDLERAQALFAQQAARFAGSR